MQCNVLGKFNQIQERLEPDHFVSYLVCKVVFRGGEGALQVLPPLVDVIPEARLNLVSQINNSNNNKNSNKTVPAHL